MKKDKEQYASWRTPEVCLLFMAAAAPFSFAIWLGLINNFTVEMVGFEGREIGILHSIREIPGLLAFTAVFLLIFVREQIFAIISLIILGAFIGITGFFPSEYSLYIIVLIMSVGFHYFETVQMSLTLQWVSKAKAPKAMGQQLSVKSFAAIIAYAVLWLTTQYFTTSYELLFAVGGSITIAVALYIWISFPRIEGHEAQHKKIILKKRYWLFYALTFLGGARRQIFVVFAGFLLVTKFDYTVSDISGLLLLNYVINTWFAPKLGGFIATWGERRALVVEYLGLIFVFIGYAVTENALIAAGLYVLDHMFFAFAIAQRSYIQKIADHKDIAATSSVSFSINHIAAVIIPYVFGMYLWPISHSLVFYVGAVLAGVSLLLSLNVPRHPSAGNEVNWGRVTSPYEDAT